MASYSNTNAGPWSRPARNATAPPSQRPRTVASSGGPLLDLTQMIRTDQPSSRMFCVRAPCSPWVPHGRQARRKARVRPGAKSTSGPTSGPGDLDSQPRRERLDLSLHVGAHGLGEAHVLVKGVDGERPRLAVDLGVELANEAVVVEYRQREVAPAPLRRRLVHLEDVLEVEETQSPVAVMDEAVER